MISATTKPSFYVCGHFLKWVEARRLILELRQYGYKCTHDWTRRAEVILASGSEEVNDERFRKEGEDDMMGILDADFIVVTPGRDGTKIEMGAAIMSVMISIKYRRTKRKVYVYDPHNTYLLNPFVRLPFVEWSDTWEDIEDAIHRDWPTE